MAQGDAVVKNSKLMLIDSSTREILISAEKHAKMFNDG